MMFSDDLIAMGELLVRAGHLGASEPERIAALAKTFSHSQSAEEPIEVADVHYERDLQAENDALVIARIEDARRMAELEEQIA